MEDASMQNVSLNDANVIAQGPTAKEAIRWYQEEAWRTGAIGFLRDLGDRQDFSEDWLVESLYGSHMLETTGHALDLATTVRDLEINAARMNIRHQERIRIVREDVFLQADMRAEVHRRLLKAGKNAKEIEENTQDMSSLTLMCAYLWDVEHRVPNADSKMKAIIITNFRGTKRPTPILLSTKNSFPELLRTLKEFVIARADMVGRPVAPGDDIAFLDTWRYKMAVDKSGKISCLDARWIPLAFDVKYQTLLKRLSGIGQGMMIPVITPVDMPSPPAPSTSGTMNGKSKTDALPDRSLKAQQGPSGEPVAPEMAESSMTDPVDDKDERERKLGPVNWSIVVNRYMEGRDFDLFDDEDLTAE